MGKTFYLGVVLFAIGLVVCGRSSFADDAGLQRGVKKGDFNTDFPQTIRFEHIMQSDGQQMAKQVSALLNKYGWDGWGHKKYDFGGKWSDQQAQEKKRLFNDWASGNSFEWIDPVWSFSGHNPKIESLFSGCTELTHSVIAPNTKMETKPASIPLPLEVKIGPVAVYEIDPKKIDGDPKDKRYLVMFIFNNFPLNEIPDGKYLNIETSIFDHNIYLIDLDECTYVYKMLLNGGHWGGYSERNIPRLTGVGYYEGKIAFYNVYDLNLDSSRRGGQYERNIQGDLNFYSFISNRFENQSLFLTNRKEM